MDCRCFSCGWLQDSKASVATLCTSHFYESLSSLVSLLSFPPCVARTFRTWVLDWEELRQVEERILFPAASLGSSSSWVLETSQDSLRQLESLLCLLCLAVHSLTAKGAARGVGEVKRVAPVLSHSFRFLQRPHTRQALS